MAGRFFFSGQDHRFPFATLVRGEEYDRASDLGRPSVFRRNVGVSKETFRSLFGEGGCGTALDHDFTALDRLMPHPVCGRMHRVCVLNPSPATFEAVKTLLREAYEMAVRRRSSSGLVEAGLIGLLS